MSANMRKSKTKSAVRKKIIKKNSQLQNSKPKVFEGNADKRDLMRQNIVTLLWRYQECSVAFLQRELGNKFQNQFGGELPLYFTSVLSDLKQMKVVEEVHFRGPMKLRLTQGAE